MYDYQLYWPLVYWSYIPSLLFWFYVFFSPRTFKLFPYDKHTSLQAFYSSLLTHRYVFFQVHVVTRSTASTNVNVDLEVKVVTPVKTAIVVTTISRTSRDTSNTSVDANPPTSASTVPSDHPTRRILCCMELCTLHLKRKLLSPRKGRRNQRSLRPIRTAEVWFWLCDVHIEIRIWFLNFIIETDC